MGYEDATELAGVSMKYFSFHYKLIIIYKEQLLIDEISDMKSFQVLNWVATNGVTTDENYPYKKADGISCPANMTERRTNGLVGTVFLPPNNEEVIRKVLALHGPIMGSLWATDYDFYDYRKGEQLYKITAK